jgi:Hypothetical protein (DUF2513)
MVGKSGRQQKTRWQAGFAETIGAQSNGKPGVCPMQADAHESETAVIRDMDLVRNLLLGIEADPKFDGTHESWTQPEPEDLGIIDHSFEEVAYHLTLLIEAGFVIGNTGMEMPVISRLTWEGHEFCDNIKDAGIWAKTKERMKDLPGVGLKVVAAIAEAIIKQHLGLQ